MGKGDIKTKKGKRSNGSYGKHRSRKTLTTGTTKVASTKASATKKTATGTAPKRKPKASTPEA